MGEPLIPNGYVLVARKTLESGIFSKPPLYLKVWVYLLSHAQHKDFRGLKRGQLRTSIPEMQDALSWKVGYRTEKPTKKQIFTILEWLRNPNEGVHEGNDGGPMIVTTKGTQGMVVTICNYSFYQTPENYEGNNERNAKGTTKSLRPERQGNNINKNDKNDKNDKKNNITSKKSKKRIYSDDDPNKKLAKLLFKLISKNQDIQEPDLDKWANTIRLTIEADKRTGKEVQEMIVWSSQSDFWSGVILSPTSLRKNFDKMAAQKNKQKKSNRSSTPFVEPERETNSEVSF